MRALAISKHVAGGLDGDFYYSGEWVRTFEICKALARKKVEVSLVTPKPAPQHRRRFWEEFGGILEQCRVNHYFAPTYLHLGRHGGSFRLRMFLKELQVLIKEHFDVIMYMQFGPSLLHRVPNRPPIVYASCYAPCEYEGEDVDLQAKADWSPPNARDFQLKMEDKVFHSLGRRWGVLDVRSMCLKSEAVILWHPSGYEHLRAVIPSAQKLFLIAKGVDIQACKESRLVHEKRYHVLFCGAIMERKGIYTLLKAFQMVNREMPEAKLAIAGAGPDIMMQRMLDSIQELEINAEYLGSIPFHSRLPLFHQSEIFCLPSLYDTYPTVILEAMACGLPVITTDAVDTRVEEGVTGFLVPTRDPEALASKILFLLRNPEVRNNFSREAERVAEQYDWNLIADRVIDEVVLPLTLNRREKKLTCAAADDGPMGLAQ